MARTIKYNSARDVSGSSSARATELKGLVDAIETIKDAANGINQIRLAAHYTEEDIDDDGTDETLFRVSMVMEMETTLSDEATDRDVMAQEAVDAGFDPDKSTAKDKIETRAQSSNASTST